MRNRRRLFILVSVLFVMVLVVGAINAYMYYIKDKEPPVFTYDEEAFYLSQRKIDAINDGDFSPLVEGVYANDNKDGDITDKILIQDYKIMGEGFYAIITYMVMDSSDNMVKGNRILYLKQPREISETVLKDYFHVDIDAKEVKEGTSEPPVLIMEDSVSLNLGDTFDPLNYLIELSDDVDTYDELLPNCSVEGYFNENTKGIYYLAFTATDSHGNKSEPAIIRIEIK